MFKLAFCLKLRQFLGPWKQKNPITQSFIATHGYYFPQRLINTISAFSAKFTTEIYSQIQLTQSKFNLIKIIFPCKLYVLISKGFYRSSNFFTYKMIKSIAFEGFLVKKLNLCFFVLFLCLPNFNKSQE